MRIAACALLIAGTSSCASKYNPFKVPSAELRQRVHTIAVAPLVGPSAELDIDSARAKLEPLLLARLRDGGFVAVPSETMDAIWRRAAEDVGGVFDPVTAEVDKAHYETVRDAVYRELRAQHQVDAVLYPILEVVDLFLTSGSVDYCGLVNDRVYWPGGSFDPFTWTTEVYAFCLDIVLYDMERRALYSIRHGLETIETYYDQTRAVRPLAERLQDPQRLENAVLETMGPLSGTVPQ